jgi:hypothetical protein
MITTPSLNTSSCTRSSASISRHPRWLLPSKAALGAALAMGILATGQAQAVVVNVGGQNWDVTTFTGTYEANSVKFAPPPPPAPGVMPWWGSQSLASHFAYLEGNGLYAANQFGGLQFDSVFAWDALTYGVGGEGSTSDSHLVSAYPNTDYIWAQVTPYNPTLPSNSVAPPPWHSGIPTSSLWDILTPPNPIMPSPTSTVAQAQHTNKQPSHYNYSQCTFTSWSCENPPQKPTPPPEEPSRPTQIKKTFNHGPHLMP